LLQQYKVKLKINKNNTEFEISVGGVLETQDGNQESEQSD
jgi:hypothetical protein